MLRVQVKSQVNNTPRVITIQKPAEKLTNNNGVTQPPSQVLWHCSHGCLISHPLGNPIIQFKDKGITYPWARVPLHMSLYQ